MEACKVSDKKIYIFYDKNLLENSAAMATLVVTDSMVFAEQ